MKRTFRILATFLSIALIICALPQSVLAQIGDLLSDQDTEATETVSPDIYVLGEVIDSRTETSKTFRMSDGSFIAADYGHAIHYAGEDGAWTDYDNTLTFSEALARDSEDMAGYGNTGSDLHIKLANNSNSNNLVKLTMGDYKISLHLVGANKSKALEVYPAMEDPTGNDIDSVATLHKFSAGAIYEDILPDVDLEYIISGGSVKENIIIKDTADSYTYTFELKLQGLVPEVDDEGNILLKDETTDETQLVIPAGYMYDADGAYSDAVTYGITHKNGKKYTLTVTADADWINADERVFPVTVDPSVQAFKKNGLPVYAVVREFTTTPVADTQISAGFYLEPVTSRQYLLVQQTSLPAIPDSATIVEAKMTVLHTGTDRTGITLAAKPLMSAWEAESVSWPTMSCGSDVLDYATLNATTQGTEIKFDVTRIAREWYENPNNNHGVALCPLQNDNATGLAYFSVASGQKPNFLIYYRDAKGLESTWTYASHNAGVAGVGYVNGSNGNLVFVNGDMATEGSIIPITVSHVYNSALAGMEFTANSSNVNAPFTTENDNTLVGKGWKLSVQETIVSRLIPDGDDTISDTWYVFNDADGTELYFYHSNTMDSGVYKSEDGYGLTLTVASNGTITLADDYGNEKLFTNGRLTKITDVYGNRKEFVYNTNNQLTSVRYYPAGLTSYYTQLTFTYNANGALQRITNAYNTADYVEYEYSTTYNGTRSTGNSGYLRKVTYSLGGYTLFNYNSSGMLSSVINGDNNYTVNYSYANKRVRYVAESVTTAVGQTVSFAYASNRFEVRTAGLDDVHNTDDDILTTVLFDNYGRAVCSYSSDVDGDTIYGTSYAAYTDTALGSKANNKITIDAVKGITEENFVANGNCEVNSWATSAVGTGYTAGYTSTARMYGASSYKLSSTTGGTGYAGLSQTVSIPSAGTYTLSAYVKAENITTSSGGGAYLLLAGTASEKLTGTTNASVQNGWRRISVTKTFSAAGNYAVQIRLANATGTAYVDGIQLELAETPSDFNFVQNGSIRNTSNWFGTFTATASDNSRGHVGVITGSPTAEKYAAQTIALNTDLNTTFMLSGWAKASSADLFSSGKEMTEEEFATFQQQSPTEAAKIYRTFGLLATLAYSDGSTQKHYVSFNPDVTDWQYVSMAIVPRKKGETLTVTSITVKVVYDYNVNTMYFDDVCLTVEPAQTYAYDVDGNLITATDMEGNASTIDYDDNGIDIQKITTPTGAVYEYKYLDTHDVSEVTRTVNNITQKLTYAYDAYGNATTAELTATDTTEKFTSSATYGEFGNYLIQSINSLGNATNYSYDSVTKLLAFIENANSNRTAYTYNDRQQVQEVYLDADEDGVSDTAEASVAYVYDQVTSRLSGITTAKTTYTLTYDLFGNLLSVKAGENTLATYTYASGNGKLTRLTYGSGDYEQYTYDHLDRLVKVVYNGNASSGYELFYDANGRLYKTVDYQAGLTHLYEYDSLNRLIFAWQKNTSTGATVLEVQNAYDELGRAKGSTYVIGDTTQTYGITYEDITSLVKNFTTPHGTSLYLYDKFDRLSRKYGIAYFVGYTYVSGSQRIASYVISQSDFSSTAYSYTYDALGNITQIKKNGTTVSNYEYDSLGRLIREDDCTNSISWVYTYDNAGNLLKKYTFYGMTGIPASHLLSLHPYNGSEISSTYTYSSSAWGDLLTSYNGITIEYTDSENSTTIGNPLNWRNTTNMEWHQRSLTSMTIGGINVTYTYNADGIRTTKTRGHLGYAYVLDGSTILKETIYNTGTVMSTLYYYYDESGISGVEYNGTKYSYIKNLQGDVIGIINANGVTVVEYTYDAWGNVLSITGSMASTLGAANPFRYRGYYYDNESGWYYLNSRYYDPQTGRFLNADAYVSTGQGILGYNVFAYCLDNPVTRVDSIGTDSICVTADEDDNPLNDMGYISPGGGGAGGGSTAIANGTGGVSGGSLDLSNVKCGDLCTSSAPTIRSVLTKASVSYYLSQNRFMDELHGIYDIYEYATANKISEGAMAHGNSSNSTKTQHLYAIYKTSNTQVVKVGISGRPLNLNGTSPRANIQVNYWNRSEGEGKYAAIIIYDNIPGRRVALDLEKVFSRYYRETKHSMTKHHRP